MSNKAMNWAWDSGIDPGPRFVLVALADHAGDHNGEDWTCFPSIERLVKMTGQGARSVERNLAWLVKNRWISRKRRVERERKDGVWTYTLHRARSIEPAANMAADEAADPVGHTANMAADQPDDMPPNPTRHAAKSDTTCRHIGGCAIEEPPMNPHEPPLSVGVGVGVGGRSDGVVSEDDAFGQVLTAWLSSGKPNSRTQPAAAREAWNAAVRNVAPDKLAAAARRALAEDDDFRRRGPCGLQRWLSGRAFEAFLAPGRNGVGAPAGSGKFADAAVRASVVGAKDDAFVASYLDPAGWDFTTRTITPRTSFALGKLGELTWLWAKLGVTIGGVAKISGDGEAGR